MQASKIADPTGYQFGQASEYARRLIEQYVVAAKTMNLVVQLIVPMNDQAVPGAYLQTFSVLPACRDLSRSSLNS